jgi:hypothetical protein
MRDKRGLHQKVQEMCDCFLTADPLQEMSHLKEEQDEEEAALKWLALAILHGIDSNAKKITISSSKNGDVEVRAKYRESKLPSPTPEVGHRILESVKRIAQFEKDKGKTPLAVGIGDSNLEICLKMEKEDECDIVELKFPG